VLPTLKSGAPMISRTVKCPYGEGDIGTALAEVQKAHPDTVIGSYPKFDENRFSTDLVIRGRDEARVEAAEAAVRQMLAEIAAARQAAG
jgi:molybdopterin-biosynthesis enzyme MoeA-like protein